MMRVAVLLVAVSCIGAAPPTLTVKTTSGDIPDAIPAALRTTFKKEAYVVADAKGPLVTFWLRADIPAQVPAATFPAYSHVSPTTFLGVVQFARTWVDYHQQEVDAGFYTLRLAVQPKSKDHEGTAPHRDFCILSPLAKDAKPDVLPLKSLLANSGTITGGTHPVVLLLYPAPKPDSAQIVRHGKAGQALHARTTLRVKDQAVPFAFAFNVLGSGTDE